MNYPKAAHQTVEELHAYVPGVAVVDGVAEPIKLSSNENPLGPSPKVQKMLGQFNANKMARYPEGSSAELRKEIAKQYNIDANRIVCGVGSDELISLLCSAYAGEGDEVLYSQYGFLMYPIATKVCGATPVTAAEKNMTADVNALLDAVTDRTRLLFLANPNNPTGSYISRAEVRRLREGLRKDVILVLDGAYAEYVEHDDYTSGAAEVDELENVVMTRTFSKIHGLGGIRLGWGYMPAHIADMINRIRSPFNIAVLNQEIGKIAIADQEHVRVSREHNNSWLKMVTAQFRDMGYQVYDSVANFVLMDMQNEARAEEFNAFLMQHGVIVRDMKAYQLPSCLRITIGTESENQRLLELAEQFLA